MCARFTVLSDTPSAAAIAGCVIPLSRNSTIWMRWRCAGGIFHRSAVSSLRTSALLHFTICSPESDGAANHTPWKMKTISPSVAAPYLPKTRFKPLWRWYKILEFDRLIIAWHRSSETSRRLDDIPGVGPAPATALVASIADPNAFRSGRDFSAWIGVVPKQNSSGGKDRLGSISKRGDRYLRRPVTA